MPGTRTKVNRYPARLRRLRAAPGRHHPEELDMNFPLLRDNLAPLGPCAEALRWLGRRRSASKAWADCPRGDWMLWLLARVGADRRTLVLAACDCARLALVHVPTGEDRPRLAIETAEAWARGEATEEEMRRAAAAAYAAAAYAAARAADAAYAAARPATVPADAAYAAAYAADAKARDAALAHCADLVRARFPCPPEVTR